MPLDIAMPWLRTTSPIESLSSGASAGASAARLEQEATSESARIGMEARRLNQQAAFESARLNQAAEQSQMEFQARQKVAEQNQLRQDQRLNIENAYKTAALGVAKGRLEETQRMADEKAKAATLAFQREQGFAKAVASGMPVMEAYQRFPVSSALLGSVTRAQLKEDKSTQPLLREGKFPLIEYDPKTGTTRQVYTPPKPEGLSATDKEDLKDLRAQRKDIASKISSILTPANQKPALTTELSDLDKRIEAIKHPTKKPETEEKTSKFGHPKVGEIRFGHRFKGGDPNDQNNWEVVKEGE